MRSTLRKVRKARGLTVPQLAKMLGVSVRTVYYLEQGKRNPSKKVMDRLEDLFGMHQRDLLAPDPAFDFRSSKSSQARKAQT